MKEQLTLTMRPPFPKAPGRSSLVVVALAVALAYWLYSPGGILRTHATRSADPPVVSGSLRVDGPYFSDRSSIAGQLIAAINHTRSSLDVAVYSFTQPDLAAALASAYRRGVRVRVVSDKGQSRYEHSEIPYLRKIGIPVRLSMGFRGRHSLMHNKFAVFDGRSVVTGSYNWTISASDYNYENMVFISDPEIAERYEQEFQHLWAQAY